MADKYKEYTCGKNLVFNGEETIEELEAIILNDNDPLMFYFDEKYNQDTIFKDVKTVGEFILRCEAKIDYKDYVRDDTPLFGVRNRLRMLPTVFTKTKVEQHKGAYHGRSLADMFLLCRYTLPNVTLREYLTAFYRSPNFNVCRNIEKRLYCISTWNNIESHRIYTSTDLNTIDEFNKTVKDWCDALGIRHTITDKRHSINHSDSNSYRMLCFVNGAKLDSKTEHEIDANYKTIVKIFYDK